MDRVLWKRFHQLATQGEALATKATAKPLPDQKLCPSLLFNIFQHRSSTIILNLDGPAHHKPKQSILLLQYHLRHTSQESLFSVIDFFSAVQSSNSKAIQNLENGV